MVQKAKNRRDIATIIITVLVVIGTTITTIFLYRNASADIERNTLALVETIARAVDRQSILDLAGSESDLETQNYLTLKSLLQDFVDINPKVEFIYIMGIRDGNMFFFIDSDPSEDQALPGEVYAEASAAMWRTFSTGESQFEGVTADEWGTWISAYAPITNDAGHVIAILGADIAESTYTYEVLSGALQPVFISIIFLIILFFIRHAQMRERRSLEDKRELLSVASHEIRSPLVSIKWVLEDMLKHPDGIPETDVRLLTAVHKNAAKIVDNINNILNESPDWDQVAHEDVAILPLFQDIAATLDIVSIEHKAKIIIDPSITPELVVRGDRQNLLHAFYNVVNNAIKYTKPDTDVTISYVRTAEYHQFHIADHGIGIKPEDRDKVFAGNYRTAEAIASGQPGTGLGLYFVKKIIAAHHGKIYVDPTYGDGTNFIIELPI